MVIKVNPLDELASIIDEVVTQESETVYLDMPDNAYVAQNVLNFRLLKREAEAVGKEVIIVSRNPRVKSLAQKADLQTRGGVEDMTPNEEKFLGDTQGVGFTDISYPEPATPKEMREVAEDIEDLKRETEAEIMPDINFYPQVDESEKDPQEYFDKKIKQSENEAMLDELEEPAKKRWGFLGFLIAPFRKPDNLLRGSKKAMGSTFHLAKSYPRRALVVVTSSIILVLVGYMIIFVLPRATVALVPKSVQDTIVLQVAADSNVSSSHLSRGIVPAQVLEERRENTFTFQSTGTAQIEDRASGTIRVYNEYSSAPQTLVANTRFLSSDGKLFRTKETIVVPGATISSGRIIASSILVDIIADEAGVDYNISPTNFSIPGFSGTDKYLAFYGRSESSMSGGFKGTRTVVAQGDIDRARQEIEDEFLAETEDLLRQKIPGNLFILEDTIEVFFSTFDIGAVALDPKDEFSIRAVAVARAFLIDKSDIINAIEYYFVNSSQYNSEYELSDTRAIEYVIKEIDYQRGLSRMDVNIKQLFNRHVNTEGIYDEIRGRGEIDVRRILSQKDGLDRAQVRFWPMWVRTVPNDLEKIEIIVEYKTELSE